MNSASPVFTSDPVIQLLQAVAGDMRPENLLPNLMRLSLERGNADRGAVVLVNGEGLLAQNKEQFVGLKPGVELPTLLVEQVLQSGEIVNGAIATLNSVAEPGQSWMADVYFAHRPVHTVLGMPLLNQTQVVGVLYLERSLQADQSQDGSLNVCVGAEHLEWLKILCAQSAILLNWQGCLQPQNTSRDGSEQGAELALKESEARFQRIVDNVPGAVYRYVARPNGTGFFSYISSRCRDIYGLEPEAVMQDAQLLWSRISAQDIRAFWESMAIAAQTLQTWSGEFRNIDPSGQTKWLQATACPERQPNGDIVWDGFVTDISKRKTTEALLQNHLAELLEWQTRYESAASASGQILYEWHPRMQQTIWGPNTEQILGYDRWEMPNSLDQWRDIIHPEDCDRFCMALEHSYLCRIPLCIEYRIRRKDGHFIWIEDRNQPFEGYADGEIRVVGFLRDISNQKISEIALQNSLKELSDFKFALDQATIVAITDAQGKITYVNDWFCEISQYSREELIGQTQQFTSARHYSPDFFKDLWLTISSGSVWRGEIKNSAKDGSEYWLEMVIVPFLDELVQPLQYLVICFETTERRQAEDALRQSEERFRLAFEQAAVGICFDNLESQTISLNQRFCDILGYSKAELLALHWTDVTYPDDIVLDQQMMRRLLTGEIPEFSLEKRYIHKNGALVWVNLNVSLTFNEFHQPRLLVAVIEDITARKEAEQALQTLNQELEQRVQQRTEDVQRQTQLLKTILNSMGDGVLVANTKGDLILHNSAAMQIIGLDFADPSAQEWRNWKIYLPDGVTPCPADWLPLSQAMRGEVVDQLEVVFRTALHAEGVYIEATVRPLTDSAGVLIGGVSVFRDVSDRKRAEIALRTSEEALRQINAELESRVTRRTAELTQAKESAEAANRAKSTFLANMSHELRTPLNAILGFSQLLSRSPALDLEQQQQIDIINRSGEHLLSLINDILEMSKIEAGRIVFKPTNFDLHLLLQNLKEMFDLKAASKGIELTIEADSTLCRAVQTDENKLRQVLINLLGNAIKFTAVGRVSLRVTNAERQVIKDNGHFADQDFYPSASIRFEVADTGPGIAPDEQALLFEPFVQTKAGYASLEGTGLGLPISCQFVQLMGGQLTVSSVLGQGTTFAFEIPVRWVEVASLPPQSPQQPILGLAPYQPRYRLLVVEDHPENGQFLAQLLQSAGFEVQRVENGQQAIALWQSWLPHLIWMDVRMPVMDGYEATRRIRELESLAPEAVPRTKILALTASAFEDERAAILAAGCDDFICKPATEKLLFEKLAEHLGVQYVYAEPERSLSNTEGAIVFDRQISGAALNVMPKLWISQLQHVARIADEELVLQLIDQIPEAEAALAATLRRMVDDLHLAQIIQLTLEAP